ncbi:hypothetical protein D9619_010167 [Psilocybe cf. subviscida]|uniref:Uncharacterized protein n=1 Tax=Psilocybe cf. subviscida TaxID=2480587 RepID=A0A8H5ERV2_9AGAR|nr:hypothetical protein D9619_010167 [Psilocybe cf. subviscida]
MNSSYVIDPNSLSWHCSCSVYRLYTSRDSITKHIPAILEGFPRASANIASVICQFTSGYTADAFERRTAGVLYRVFFVGILASGAGIGGLEGPMYSTLFPIFASSLSPNLPRPYGHELMPTMLTFTAPMANRSPNHLILYRFLQDSAWCGRWRQLSDERDGYE